ncbi:alpha 1,2-mannosyltransferase, glycosyltransferase family 15 protein [Pseudohyphozyma bogoriensis]|nr:alpha 1,2-mannosyltransferase, glycosyltransferase family 15 protein [Pseudohyphozyma bogoriensis]
MSSPGYTQVPPDSLKSPHLSTFAQAQASPLPTHNVSYRNGAGSPPPHLSVLHALTSRPLRISAWGLAIVSLLVVAAHFPSSSTSGSRRLGLGSYASLGAWKSSTAGSRKLESNEALMDPTFTVDEKTGLRMPPDVYAAALNPYKRANAAMVSLVRNSELGAMQESMRHIEERFNRKFGTDLSALRWVFMNEEPFTEEFKSGVLGMTRSEVHFAQIPPEHWSYPSWVNQTYAAEERQKMVDENVIYGGSESYRHMCRFNSGFFFKQKVLEPFDYYWRVEPGIAYSCDLDYDPFLFMQANNKKYGFTIALYEYERTIQTLWSTVREFVGLHPEYVAQNNAVDFLVDNHQGIDGRYNLCHFWSNFEIGDMRFLRSQAYQDFFEHLDQTGNFFYERWGDAPVHSIAAALFLPADEIHFFGDIAYTHNPYTHCPIEDSLYTSGKCNCDRQRNFDYDGYSCYNRWKVLFG